MTRYQKQEAKKDVTSASKPCLRSNVFRNTTNRHRDDVEVIHQSNAVNKRKAELEQLRRRSLAKDIATRLRNAEAPTGIKLNNFAEQQRKSIRVEKTKLQEAKSYMNNYRADGNELNNFTKHRRKSLQMEKAKLREAKNYMNNYRADSKELSTFSECRRKSLQLEKAKLQEAKRYMNNYRADGNELQTFTERRRKSNLREKAKLQEATSYMNNYRAESNGLLQTTSLRRSYSTGSKSSHATLNAKINSDTMTPKRLFIPNKTQTTGVWSLKQCDGRNPSKTSSKLVPLSAQTEAKSHRKKEIGDARELYPDNLNCLLTERFRCKNPSVSDMIVQVGCSNIPQDEEFTGNADTLKVGQNDGERIDSYRHVVATLFGIQSSGNFDEKEGSNILITARSNRAIDGSREILFPCNCNDMKAVNDPYNDDDPTDFRNQKKTEEFAHICERMKEKDCFICTVM